FRFDCSRFDTEPQIPCELRYPCAESLPDGLLYVPESMDQKWVIAYQKQKVILARSWTGEVQGIAETEKVGETLVLTSIKVAPGSALDSYNTPEDTFDWAIRSHALGQKIPIKASESVIEHIEKNPVITFIHFGKMLFCLGRQWNPPKPERPLRSDGALLQAFRNRSLPDMKVVLESGADVNAPLSFHGYTVLHVAMIEGDKKTIEFLLKNTADVNALDDRQFAPLGVGVVHGAPLATLKFLVENGADIHAANVDGFNYLHASAEINRVETITWLLEAGIDIHSQTEKGLCPLHIASALGHIDAVKALLKAGANAQHKSPLGTPLEIAKQERRSAIIPILEAHLSK
ncbi:MAG: ankyrin repeat domain-containing protein, partial [Planctomycetota bacterium]|nr:ankyrin repeat domain-containing protein [Planctomycetota bacterium]